MGRGKGGLTGPLTENFRTFSPHSHKPFSVNQEEILRTAIIGCRSTMPSAQQGIVRGELGAPAEALPEQNLSL